MEDISRMPYDLCRHHFREFLVGWLLEGVIHNINDLLQIISMNLEIIRIKKDADPNFPEPAWERIQHLMASVDQVTTIIENLMRKEEGPSGGPQPVVLEEIVQNELEFWKGDLFFKYKVEKNIQLPDVPNIVVTHPAMLQEIVDAALAIQIVLLRGAEIPVLEVSVEKSEKDTIILGFNRSGKGLSSLEDSLNFNNTNEPEFLALCLDILKDHIRQLGFVLHLSSNLIQIEIPLKAKA